MKNGLVISDAGPIFSLASINRLNLLNEIFEEVFIPEAVWIELTRDQESSYYEQIINYFEGKVKEIQGHNDLSLIMDYGESESVVLFREMNADYLLIDDRKARKIAENLGVNCIGTLGILIKSKEKGFVKELKPLFEELLKNKRYYSVKILNEILRIQNEDGLENET